MLLRAAPPRGRPGGPPYRAAAAQKKRHPARRRVSRCVFASGETAALQDRNLHALGVFAEKLKMHQSR
jgi:hypothetical protein